VLGGWTGVEGRHVVITGATNGIGLAAAEELGNRTVSTLDLTIDVDEWPAAQARDLPADRRLSRAHEAHEREMTVERAYRGDQSIRSR